MRLWYNGSDIILKETVVMRRFVLFLLLAAMVACACLTASAEPGKLYLVYIGGDGDVEESPNNVFRNILLHHADLQDRAEAFLVRSFKNDYSNATAIRQAKLAEGNLSPDGVNVVAGYSHGGQSVYFMNLDGVTDVFLLDACVSIGGKCSGKDYQAKGRVWSEWILETARKGINVHCYVTIGKHNEPSGDKVTLEKLAAAAEGDETLEALGDGWYRLLNENGEQIALIETALLEGTHKDICVTTEDRIAERVYQLAE